MLFKHGVLEGIVAGDINLAFRRWKKARIKPSTKLRTPVGVVKIESVRIFSEKELTESEAAKAGFSSVEEILKSLVKYEPAPLYRIELTYAGTDPRELLREKDNLSNQDLADIKKKLESFDTRSKQGPWTIKLLQMLQEMPGEKAATLAEAMNWEDKEALKRQVRKLKELGLTISLGTGYKLSPRGKAFLKHYRTIEKKHKG